MEHHAYYIEGNSTLLPALRESVRKEWRFKPHSTALVERVYEKFGIDEARELQSLALLKKTEQSPVFVIALSSITTEAQQSLLKLFEEPQEGLVFILLLPHGMLIPTLRSRFLLYPFDIKEPVRSRTEAKKFLAASGKERSALIAEMLKDDEGVKDAVRALLHGLEVELSGSINKSKEVRQSLEDIAKVRSYVTDRSPALKMLLEHLALCLSRFDLNSDSSRSNL